MNSGSGTISRIAIGIGLTRLGPSACGLSRRSLSAWGLLVPDRVGKGALHFRDDGGNIELISPEIQLACLGVVAPECIGLPAQPGLSVHALRDLRRNPLVGA